MIDTLEEINGSIAVITETWFKTSPQLEELLKDAEDVTGYGFLRKDRSETDSAASRGGGVAIVYRKNELQMTKLKVKGNFEIVAGLARRTGQRRKIITIGAYIPPSADADTSKMFLETISDAIRGFKTKYVSPYFIVAGDFNKRKIKQELKEFSDIKLVNTQATRGRHALDFIFTNFPEYIKESGTIPALFNTEGVESDHAAVHIYAKMPRVVSYSIQKYSYVKQTPEGDAEMGRIFGGTD